jgi:hypothetical protein
MAAVRKVLAAKRYNMSKHTFRRTENKVPERYPFEVVTDKVGECVCLVVDPDVQYHDFRRG